MCPSVHCIRLVIGSTVSVAQHYVGGCGRVDVKADAEGVRVEPAVVAVRPVMSLIIPNITRQVMSYIYVS